MEDVPVWRAAARGEAPDWRTFPGSCAAAVDWPASVFWRELADAHPDALIVLSTRDDPTQWWESCDATILPIVRGVKPMDEAWLPMFQSYSSARSANIGTTGRHSRRITSAGTQRFGGKLRPIASSTSR